MVPCTGRAHRRYQSIYRLITAIETHLPSVFCPDKRSLTSRLKILRTLEDDLSKYCVCGNSNIFYSAFFFFFLSQVGETFHAFLLLSGSIALEVLAQRNYYKRSPIAFLLCCHYLERGKCYQGPTDKETVASVVRELADFPARP